MLEPISPSQLLLQTLQVASSPPTPHFDMFTGQALLPMVLLPLILRSTSLQCPRPAPAAEPTDQDRLAMARSSKSFWPIQFRTR